MDTTAQACIDFVKGARHRCLTREERLDILRVYAYFRGEGASKVTQRVASHLAGVMMSSNQLCVNATTLVL